MAKAIKGFNSDLTCRDFQYEVGKTYEHKGEIKPCESGFHACAEDSPFAVWGYYPPISENGELTRYCEVTLGEVKTEGDKLVSASITVDVEISLSDFVKRSVAVLKSLISAHAATTGYGAHAATTGYGAHAATTGYGAHAATTGRRAHAATTGYGAHAATTGRMAHAATAGYGAHAATTGRMAHAATAGDQSTAMAAGVGSKVKAQSGGLFAQEWAGGKIVSNACGIVGKDGIEPDTWYVCKGGVLVRDDQ